jgi:Na+/H+-dicarboxylate symporter
LLRKKPSLFVLVLTGLLLGVFTGLFFGEGAASVKVIGDAYIGLLQMSVVPYVVVSLIVGIGRLDPSSSIRILTRTAMAAGALWLLTILTALLVPLGYPEWDSASFFSASLIEEKQSLDFLEIYIPSNPFNALANNFVPAIVLFSIAVGLALMGIEGKGALLDPLDRFGEAMLRVSGFIVRLSPVGVFAIAASTAGTIRIDEFDRLQIYFLTSVLAWSLLTFWTLPMLVASSSRLKLRHILRHSRTPLLTAFATGSLLVVLPLLADAVKRILEAHQIEDDPPIVDIVVPVSYSLPSGSLYLSVAFLLFAAWASGAPMGIAEVPTLGIVAAFTAFSGQNVAIPFLLDAFRVPADMFQLFLASDVLLGRLWTMFSALFSIALTLLVALATTGQLRWLPRQALAYLGPTAAATVFVFFLCGQALDRVITYEYREYDAFINRELLTDPVVINQLTEPPAAIGSENLGTPRLDVIRARGSLRVGYLPDSLPYAFRNSAGRVVGLDIDVANVMARDLGVELDLVRLEWEQIPAWLNTGRVDIVMSGLLPPPGFTDDILFSDSYLTETLAFVVRDHKRHVYSDHEQILRLEPLRIGYAVRGVQEDWVLDLFPDFEVVELNSPRDFFVDDLLKLDALLYSAERGSAWTLVYPDYSVAIPEPLRDRAPLIYALPLGEEGFLRYVNTVVAYEAPNRIPMLFAYWIRGEDLAKRNPRWSIRRDVLGWTGDAR